MSILNLKKAPTDPIQRLVWLGGVMEQATRELDAAFRETYFDARFKGLMPQALALGLHARKRALAYTRAENEHRGRIVRHWGDDF